MITRTPLVVSLCGIRCTRGDAGCVSRDTLSTAFVRALIRTRPQVIRIKERVEEKSGIPPDQQRLIFNGKQMCVAHRLVSYFSLRALRRKGLVVCALSVYLLCSHDLSPESHYSLLLHALLEGTTRSQSHNTRCRGVPCCTSCWHCEEEDGEDMVTTTTTRA